MNTIRALSPHINYSLNDLERDKMLCGFNQVRYTSILKFVDKQADVLISEVCKHYGIGIHEFYNDGRLQPGAEARSVVSYILLIYSPLKGEYIGGKINRDRATAIHGRGVITRLLQNNPSFAAEFKARYSKIIDTIKEEVSRF